MEKRKSCAWILAPVLILAAGLRAQTSQDQAVHTFHNSYPTNDTLRIVQRARDSQVARKGESHQYESLPR